MFACSLGNNSVDYPYSFFRVYEFWDDYTKDTAWFFRTFYYALVSQAHTCLRHYRFIKRLTKLEMGFGSFTTARQSLRGFEVTNMIRKGRVQGSQLRSIPQGKRIKVLA